MKIKKTQTEDKKKIAIFTIPNLFTYLNIICGFISILYIIEQNYNISAIFILLGMLFDFLDGFSAKLLKQYSELGKQIDSFADMLTFGVAPIVLAYANNNYISLIYKISLLIYFTGIIYRLSRYNIEPETKTGLFKGLPSTFSGGFIAVLQIWFPVALSHKYSFLIFLFLAFLSVSTLPYKKVRITNIYDAIILLAAIVSYVFIKKYAILFAFLIYLFSGFYYFTKDIIVKKRLKHKELSK